MLEDSYWPDPEDILPSGSTFLDKDNLQYLALGFIKDTNSLKALAESFTMIKELTIRGIIMPFERVTYQLPVVFAKSMLTILIRMNYIQSYSH